MKVLSTLKVNKQYMWYHTFDHVIIQAIIEIDHVSFVEYYNEHVNELTEERVQSLFAPEYESIHDKPFLIEENKEFYIILNRRKEEYHEQYKKLIERILNEKPLKLKRKQK
jgi:hypothetical protein